MPTKLWTVAFLEQSAEAAAVAGLSAFAGALNFTNGQPTLKTVIAGATAGGVAFLYSFVKNLGGVQTIKQGIKLGKVTKE